MLEQLEAVGVSYDEIVETLEAEGVQKFADSFAELKTGIEKQATNAGGGCGEHGCRKRDGAKGSGRSDASLWTSSGEEKWLGWLHAPENSHAMAREIPLLRRASPRGRDGRAPARHGRLQPGARGDAPRLCLDQLPRARLDASQGGQAARLGARSRRHLRAGLVQVGLDDRDPLSSRLLLEMGGRAGRALRRRHRSRQRAREAGATSAASRASSPASRRSAGASRRCRRSGSSRPR